LWRSRAEGHPRSEFPLARHITANEQGRHVRTCDQQNQERTSKCNREQPAQAANDRLPKNLDGHDLPALWIQLETNAVGVIADLIDSDARPQARDDLRVTRVLRFGPWNQRRRLKPQPDLVVGKGKAGRHDATDSVRLVADGHRRSDGPRRLAGHNLVNPASPDDNIRSVAVGWNAELGRRPKHVEELVGDEGGWNNDVSTRRPDCDFAPVVSCRPLERAEARQPVLENPRRESEVPSVSKEQVQDHDS
jgi:hypothetical protein